MGHLAHFLEPRFVADCFGADLNCILLVPDLPRTSVSARNDPAELLLLLSNGRDSNRAVVQSIEL